MVSSYSGFGKIYGGKTTDKGQLKSLELEIRNVKQKHTFATLPEALNYADQLIANLEECKLFWRRKENSF